MARGTLGSNLRDEVKGIQRETKRDPSVRTESFLMIIPRGHWVLTRNLVHDLPRHYCLVYGSVSIPFTLNTCYHKNGSAVDNSTSKSVFYWEILVIIIITNC